MSLLPVDETSVRKVLDLVDAGLVRGLGLPNPGEMCLEAVVSIVFDQKHGDRPTCVEPSICQFGINMNDNPYWTSHEARAKGMRRFAIAQLGSVGLSRNTFSTLLLLNFMSSVLPECIRKVVKNLQAERPETDNLRMLRASQMAEESVVTVYIIPKLNRVADQFEATAQHAEIRVRLDAVEILLTKFMSDSVIIDSASDNMHAFRRGLRSLRECLFQLLSFVEGYLGTSQRQQELILTLFGEALCEFVLLSDNRPRFVTDVIELAVQALIAMGSEGSKYLYLTEGEFIERPNNSCDRGEGQQGN